MTSVGFLFNGDPLFNKNVRQLIHLKNILPNANPQTAREKILKIPIFPKEYYTIGTTNMGMGFKNESRSAIHWGPYNTQLLHKTNFRQ